MAGTMGASTEDIPMCDVQEWPSAAVACGRGRGRGTRDPNVRWTDVPKEPLVEANGDTLAHWRWRGLKRCTSMITTLGRQQQWQAALRLLGRMRLRGPPPSVITYSACISICGHSRQWAQALALLKEMQDSRVVLDEIAYAASVSACEKSRRWVEALELLREMWGTRVTACVMTYSSVISACSKSLQWGVAGTGGSFVRGPPRGPRSATTGSQ